jgi:hypothetical protein
MDPATLTAIKLALDAKKTLDQMALKRQVAEIQRSVDAIGQHLAEDVMARMRAGFDHLETAITVRAPSLRAAEFGLARGVFAELAGRRGGDALLLRHYGTGWQQVSAMGYLGNYFYFLLQDQPEAALINAYHSAELYPSMALTVLPRNLFSPATLASLPVFVRTPDEVRAEFARQVTVHHERRREYGLDLAWRVPAAAAVAIAGLAGAAVTPSLAARGVQGAAALLAQSRHGLLPPEQGPRKKELVERLDAAEQVLQPVVAEARRRRTELERRVGS